MKKVYEAPNAEMILFLTQDVLTPSGDSPLVGDGDNGGSSVEIGTVPLF